MSSAAVVNTVDEESISKPTTLNSMLRAQLVLGATPEEATETVLRPYGGPQFDPLCAFVWPTVLRLARDIELALERENRQSVFFSNSESDTARARAIALPRTVYRMPNGEEVLWDDLTIDMIDLKIAFLRTQMGGLVDHMGILQAARKLLVDYGAVRLNEVPGWVEMVREELAREVDPDAAVDREIAQLQRERRKAKAAEPSPVTTVETDAEATATKPEVVVSAPVPVRPVLPATPTVQLPPRRRRVVPQAVEEPAIRKRRPVTV